MDLCLLVLHFKALTQLQQHMFMIQAVITSPFRVINVAHVIATPEFLPILVTTLLKVQLITKIHPTPTKHCQVLRDLIT